MNLSWITTWITNWNLQAVSIKARLWIFFGAVVVIMLLGSISGLWQFGRLSGYAARVAEAERGVTALSQLSSRVVTLMSRLQREAENQNAAQFEYEAHRLLADFQKDLAPTDAWLQAIAQQGGRHAIRAASIQAMLAGLPERVMSFVELANSGDWIVLRARLLNQADHSDEVITALMEQAGADLTDARKRLTQDLERAQRSATRFLILSAVLSLAAVALLGVVVTRTITKPLKELDVGTKALAAGDFKHRVEVRGSDELAHLAEAFNHSAKELARLFEAVRHERAKVEAAHTALKQRAQELARANADLQQFAYSASHDLQEPLRVIALYSQLLHRRYSGQLDRSAEDYIEYIFRSALQLEQLIKDLLAYTQTAAADQTVTSTDVTVVLERVLHMLEVTIRDQNCRIIAHSLPSVKAHEFHVQQVLQNLIANAIRYRGDLTPEICITAERQDGQWLFSVRDNGIGIDPQYAKQIFGIFKRLHGHKYPGTGIGLAICQKIVEGYGGRIWVESELGSGAAFRFTLPAA